MDPKDYGLSHRKGNLGYGTVDSVDRKGSEDGSVVPKEIVPMRDRSLDRISFFG